ncbi:MAG: hypothetical protein ACD_2C00107G0009 [uncultured bacterium (gcode 4)]|uniref:HD domain-containing protein n=1 Tax=uncultured bacterium (gcode 4) TaxID=1234023 RepID=K2GH53_9BACT|nr:MAG: hypothetical protein ACD_2C00107G0009 [uncultured bacterium (gcode 4)]
MIGYQIWLIFRWISIYRWNNFPRIENISTNDNLAFVLHTIILLSSILEEKEWKKVDLWYIFKKILFESFDTYILSDINSDVQYRVKEKNSAIFKLLQEKVYGFIYNLNLPDSILEDIKFIHDNKNNPKFELEDRLYHFSKLWVAYYEAHFNGKIYDEIYEPIMNNISTRIKSKEYAIFLKYIDIDKKDSELEKYLLNVRRLQFNYRWNRMKRMYPISVMSHLYVSFFLAYLIWKLEWKTEKETIVLMKKALFHDIPEAITGDIVSPTKKAVKWFEQLLADVEKDMLEEYLLVYINKYKFYNEFKDYMLDPFAWDEGKLVKLADIFSALFEARMEKSDEYIKTFNNIKRYLHTLPFPSINYLLKFWVDYFDDNIEDMIHL